MRLLCTLRDPTQSEQLSAYLSSKGISNNVSPEKNNDWGSEDYGTYVYRIWIIDEDQLDLGNELYEQFLKSPPPPVLKVLPKKTPRPAKIQVEPSGNITWYIILVCCLLLGISAMTSPKFTDDSSQVYVPAFTSPIKKELLFDYPKAYEILSKIITLFGIDALEGKATAPQANVLIQELNNTPYWEGAYDLVLGKGTLNAPLFEKIREGEVWRIFTPIFLHGDIFHLMFNMLWLYVLGRQMENRLGGIRYILFILLTAAFSNTVQYLMGGPNFIGFSGVLCAMITFIYVRQKIAPWEMYNLQRSTFMFIMIFIFAMAGVQALTFGLELFTGQTLTTSIANTAHLSGAFLGYCLGYTPWFAKPKKISA
ncbi:MAG: rhomboid family intramembrane serine protease [Parachlamydiaceae bacterium]